jgi:hypothetical protein
LEQAARRGRAEAIRELAGPDFPEALEYLYDWLYELHGRSGVGFNGFGPLTYETVMAWASLTGAAPSPLDVRALLTLDSILLSPPDKPST